MIGGIKLNTEAFNKAIKEKGWNDSELATKMGVSTTQIWRVSRLPDDDPRRNDPGKEFIAGALNAFPDKKFEDLFFLDSKLRERNDISVDTQPDLSRTG